MHFPRVDLSTVVQQPQNNLQWIRVITKNYAVQPDDSNKVRSRFSLVCTQTLGESELVVPKLFVASFGRKTPVYVRSRDKKPGDEVKLA